MGGGGDTLNDAQCVRHSLTPCQSNTTNSGSQQSPHQFYVIRHRLRCRGGCRQCTQYTHGLTARDETQQFTPASRRLFTNRSHHVEVRSMQWHTQYTHCLKTRGEAQQYTPSYSNVRWYTNTCHTATHHVMRAVVCTDQSSEARSEWRQNREITVTKPRLSQSAELKKKKKV